MRLLLIANACCASLLCLQVLQTSAQAPVPAFCGIAGYDVAFLASSDHWLIRGAKDNCIVDDYDEESVVYCEYYIAVCHSLPDNYTSGVANVSVVEKVYLTNGTTRLFPLGNYNTESGGHNPTSLTYNGFYTTWKGSDKSFCDSTQPEVTMVFQCDGSAVWETSNPNVTQFKVAIIRNPLDQCLYAITVKYAGACYWQPTPPTTRCHLNDYDVKPLIMRPYWVAQLPAIICYDSDKTGYIGCVMYFAFCHALPPNITEVCQDSAVCQTRKLDSGGVSYSMGRFFNYTLFKKNDNIEGFHVDYSNGTTTDDCRAGLITRIILCCNSSAVWESTDVSKYTKVSEIDLCTYIISMQYAGACARATIKPPSTGPMISGPTAGLTSEPTARLATGPTDGLSGPTAGPIVQPTGWIIGLIIVTVLFVAVLTYLGVGAAYQYFAVGARGQQILPYHNFLSAVSVYIGEGCKYCLNVITCFRFAGSTKKVEAEYSKVDISEE